MEQGIYRGLICQSWPTLVRIPVEEVEELLRVRDVRPVLRSMASGVARERPLLSHGVYRSFCYGHFAEKVHV